MRPGPTRPGGAGPEPPPEARRHHRGGCQLVGEGRLVEAESEFRAAVRAFPAFPEAHGDLGVALARRGELSAAEAAFRLAVRFGPARAVAYLNLATCLLQQGRHAETEEWARQAAHLDPAGAESHRLVGCALEARGNFAGAETAFRDAARLDPNLADAHWRLGGLLVRRERPQEAEAAYREAVRLKPDHAGAWVALGNLLEAEGRAPEAADCCRRAVQLDPGSAELHNCLGVALAGADRPEEAEAAYREALRLDPNMVTAHSNLGNTLRALDRLDEAEAALRGALRLKADYPEAHNNLGIVLVQQGRTDEGLGCYEEALRLRPEYPEARLNRSLSWLGAGDFARGWPEYEWRWKMRHIKPPPATAPRWDGGPVGGRSVLVLSEQGLGDTIHFVRYARALAARGATVLVDCPEPLAGVVATCPGVDRAVARGTAVPAHDLSVPLLSLPGLLGVPPDAPVAPVPYVRPAPGRADHWRAELAGAPGFRVGIAWQGSKVHRGDRLRSVPLTRFAALAAVPGVRLFSLQKGPGSEQLTGAEAAGMGVVDLGGRTDPDMGDVGALMTALDLVVTVDTALAHLAGALGLPVWVAVPYAADWRWLQGREDTIWYPTMRLFRQPRRGDWDAVFARLAAELAPLVAARAGTEGAGA